MIRQEGTAPRRNRRIAENLGGLPALGPKTVRSTTQHGLLPQGASFQPPPVVPLCGAAEKHQPGFGIMHTRSQLTQSSAWSGTVARITLSRPVRATG